MHIHNRINRLKSDLESGSGDGLMEVIGARKPRGPGDLSEATPLKEEPGGAELEERAPRLAGGKWSLDGKTFANEGAAIKAAAAESASNGGKAVKIWEKGDAVQGITGGKGYSVSVKQISRKGQFA